MLTRNGLIAFNWCTYMVYSGSNYSASMDRTYKNLNGELVVINGDRWLIPYYYGFFAMLSSITLVCGNGTSPATVNDYNLEKPLDNMLYTNNVHMYDNDGSTPQDYIMRVSTVVVNNSNETKEINEIMCRGLCESNYFCLAREVLDKPIIIKPNQSKIISYTIKGADNFTSNLLGIYGSSRRVYNYDSSDSTDDETSYKVKRMNNTVIEQRYTGWRAVYPPIQGAFLRCGIGKQDKPANQVYTMKEILKNDKTKVTYQTSSTVNLKYTNLLNFGYLFTAAVSNITSEDVTITELGLIRRFNASGYPDDRELEEDSFLLTYQVLDEPVIIRPGETKTFELTI